MLDLSRFSSDLPRYDVAKMVYKRFEGSASVQSIQFVPGKNVQITFKDSNTKESIEKHEYITINDVRCAVVGGGPKVQIVLIHHYPFEEDNHRLWIALSSFGEVRDIRCLESGHMARDCKNPPKSWSAGVSSGGIAIAVSGTAGGAAAGVLDPTPAEASGRGPSSELQPSGSDVSRSWASVMDMRDNELSPPSFGEGLVADDTIRNLSNESNDNISNTVVIDEGDVVTVESSVNNTVDGNKNNSGKNSNNNNKNSNVYNSNNATIRLSSNVSNDTISNTEVIDERDVVTAENCVNNTDESTKHNSDKNSNNSNKNSNQDICSNTELSNELSQSQDSSSSDLSQSVLLGDAEMIEASGVRKRGISSVNVSSDGAPTRVPASRNGAKKRVSDRASSQEPRRAVHANLPSAVSSIPLRKRS